MTACIVVFRYVLWCNHTFRRMTGEPPSVYRRRVQLANGRRGESSPISGGGRAVIVLPDVNVLMALLTGLVAHPDLRYMEAAASITASPFVDLAPRRTGSRQVSTVRKMTVQCPLAPRGRGQGEGAESASVISRTVLNGPGGARVPKPSVCVSPPMSPSISKQAYVPSPQDVVAVRRAHPLRSLDADQAQERGGHVDEPYRAARRLPPACSRPAPGGRTSPACRDGTAAAAIGRGRGGEGPCG